LGKGEGPAMDRIIAEARAIGDGDFADDLSIIKL
jgi:hypothetical protein